MSTKQVIIPKHSVALIPTGVFLDLDKINNYYESANFVPPFLDLRIRSSLALKGVFLANGAGVIDSDYPDEIKVPLYNSTDEAFTVSEGDRIAQLLCTTTYRLKGNVIATMRKRSGGFGSTGGQDESLRV
jgi:dUTP pyrophosphatase